MEKQKLEETKQITTVSLDTQSVKAQINQDSKFKEIRNVYMGIDIGSVSIKILLLDEQENIIERLWLRNQGSPIESSKKGLAQLKRQLEEHGILNKIRIIGVGTTGSARYLIKSVIGGDIAKTEIIAHAVAAIHYNPDVRTILEIGGQDSKIILLRNGIVSDFAMNSVCAAGTGSFLDHQASRLGIPIEKFGEFALRASENVTIAGRCGVFAESDMIHKAQMGYSKESIIRGLCDALVRNYLNNVGKGKEIKEPILFQGGVAFNKGLIKAFQEELHKKVIVPENGLNIMMGAYGAALLVKEEAERTQKMIGTWETKFRGFDLLHFDFETKAFQCQGCPNRCEVVSVYMHKKDEETGEEKKELVARWGDRCGKWAVY